MAYRHKNLFHKHLRRSLRGLVRAEYPRRGIGVGAPWPMAPVTPPVSMGSITLRLQDGPIRFELRRSSRRTIGITVEMGGEVVVTAPRRASLEKIHETLTRHRAWLRRQVIKLRAVPPPRPPTWADGEPQRILGRDYPLRVVPGSRKSVRRTLDSLRVELPDPGNREAVRKLVEGWYLEEARELFHRRMAELIWRTPALGLKRPPHLGLRRMTRRWGSCSPKGRILMNTHAVKLPQRLVDYILMHELCHLRVPNHSRAFWTLLGQCMPDWKRRKTELDAEVL